VEYKPNKNTGILCIHSNIYSPCTPKCDLVERPQEEEKKKRKRLNSNEVHHIYVGKRHKETVKQHRMWETNKGVQWRGVTLT
jgi:hypothetical protein